MVDLQLYSAILVIFASIMTVYQKKSSDQIVLAEKYIHDLIPKGSKLEVF